MNRISFSSVLHSRHREELENLMFFNPHQQRFIEGITNSIEQYGLPRIVAEGDQLRIQVDGLPMVQALYALETNGQSERPVGVMIHARVDHETMVLLHLGVSEEYSVTGAHSGEILAMRLVNRLREAARLINGVTTIIIMYGESKIRKLPV